MSFKTPTILQTAAPIATAAPTARPNRVYYYRFRGLERYWYVLTHPDFESSEWVLTAGLTIEAIVVLIFLIWLIFSPKQREKRAAWVARRPERKEKRRKHRTPVSAKVVHTENVRTVSYPGGFTRAMIGKAAMGDIGMLIGIAASERVSNDVYVTFLVTYEDGHTRHRRVWLQSDAFKRYSALCKPKRRKVTVQRLPK